MIRKADNIHYSLIIEIWELSVRATHHFLPEDYLQVIRNLLPGILPQVDLFIYQDKKTHIKGFLGVADKKIEMLFIHPVSRGEGIGKALTEFAIHELHANSVDVNEQNKQAIGFYNHLGFVETGRSETDGLGKPFPLIHMQLPAR